MIETKLKEQLAKVNPVLRGASKGTLHLSPDIRFVIQIDDFGTKRPLPQEVLVELKKELKIEAATVSTSLPSLTTYPKPSSIFTGMEEERKKFKESLGKASFISIEGAGGFGKTEFAAKCIDEFVQKDKVVWFDCLPESKLDSLIGLAGYADVLKGENKTELAKYSGFTDLIERDEKVLFLDNFHDVADPSFKEFFKFSDRRINKTKIILITREHPNVEVRVAPVDIKGLKDSAVDFAKKLRETFYTEATVSDSELQDICKKVDGHPLAIELALQLISYGESPRNIVKKIVEAEDKSADLSHRLLDEIFNHPKSTEQEKKVMLLFSVFRGDVDKKAISYLLDGEDANATLRKLIDKKMIARSGDRMSTHSLVREFCYKRLENKKEAHLKASAYYKTLRTDKFDPTLEEEIAHHLLSCEYFEALADLISEKGEEFILTGNTNSLREMIDKVVANAIERPIFYVFYGDIATIRGEWNKASEFYEKAFAFRGVDETVMAEAYIKYGEMLFRRGNVKEAQKYFEDAHSLCKKSGDKKGEARCLNDMGLVNDFFGNLSTAEGYLTAALNIRKDIEDKSGIAASLCNIGNALNTQGDLKGALGKYEQSLKIREEIGDKQGIATALSNIGGVLNTQGDLKGALEKCKQSLKIDEGIGDKQGMAISLNNFGIVLNTQGDLKGALEKCKQSLEIKEEIGDKSGIATSLNDIGNILQAQGDLTGALENYKQGLKIKEEIGDKQGITTSLKNIGSVLSDQDDLKGALEKFKQSLKIDEEIGSKSGIATSLNNIGNILHAQGNLKGALEKYKEGLQIKEEMGCKKATCTGYHNLGTIHFDEKQFFHSLKNFFISVALANQMGIPYQTTAKYINGVRTSLGLSEFKKLADEAFDNLSEELKPFIKLEEFTSDVTVHREAPKIGRNDPCPCGSGKKYKKCHGK